MTFSDIRRNQQSASFRVRSLIEQDPLHIICSVCLLICWRIPYKVSALMRATAFTLKSRPQIFSHLFFFFTISTLLKWIRRFAGKGSHSTHCLKRATKRVFHGNRHTMPGRQSTTRLGAIGNGLPISKWKYVGPKNSIFFSNFSFSVLNRAHVRSL